MNKKVEIISAIRNKLQTTRLIIERIEAGEEISESFIDLAINDLKEAQKLLETLKKGA